MTTVITSHRSATVVMNGITVHISVLQFHIIALEGRSPTGLFPRLVGAVIRCYGRCAGLVPCKDLRNVIGDVETDASERKLCVLSVWRLHLCGRFLVNVGWKSEKLNVYVCI
jgi:hypothetical protein